MKGNCVMMNVDVKTLLTSDKIREIFELACKNDFYENAEEPGCLELRIGDVLDEYDLEDSPWETYDEFLAADQDERDEWCWDNDIHWFETMDDAWEYYAYDWINHEYECWEYHEYGIEAFFEHIERYTDITSDMIFEMLNNSIKKALKIDYRKAKNETSVEMFSGMISGYFNEDEFMEYDSDYKFNNFNFNFHQNFDLAAKFLDNKIEMNDKAEATIIFNDIKERLIAA